ncbi:MAG TPA: hypothetical protein VJ765_06525 [Chitinophagaceae bacterium]|nr:hypothetical protein [Chitinophagaceae bacterium]
MFEISKTMSTIIPKNRASLHLLCITLLLSCSDNTGSLPIYGKYKMFSNDPAVRQFIANEDNYIQVNPDKTIVYNSTINNKPKFNFKGEYDYEKESGTLNIKWTAGGLPAQLKIEVTEEDYIIRIGETTYKRVKAN